MKRIVIPTDFTPGSQLVLERVLRFLHECPYPCELVLLNTYLVKHTDPARVIELNDELKKKSLDGLNRLKQEVSEKLANPLVTIDIASHLGSLQNVIQNFLMRDRYEIIQHDNHEALENNLKHEQRPLLVVA